MAVLAFGGGGAGAGSVAALRGDLGEVGAEVDGDVAAAAALVVAPEGGGDGGGG